MLTRDCRNGGGGLAGTAVEWGIGEGDGCNLTVAVLQLPSWYLPDDIEKKLVH